MTMLLQFGFEDFEKVKRAFDPEVVTKAVNTTIPRTMRKARTNVSKEIRKTYNVKAGTIKDTVSLTSRKQAEGRIAILSYRGASLPVDRFGTRVRRVTSSRGRRRRAVSVKIKKRGGRKVISGAFPLHGESGPTMKRRGDARLPIERVFTLSVPQMINDDVRRTVEDKIGADANIELNRNLQFFQERASR